MGWIEVGRPGTAPGGAPSFLARTRKEGKRNAPRWLRPRSFRYGATWVGEWAGWAAELTSRFQRSVQTAAASQLTKRWHSAVPPPPRPVPDPGASRRGVEVHTGHCFARPWEPSPLPTPRGRGSKAGVRRMVVGLCPLPFALCPLPFALCSFPVPSPSPLLGLGLVRRLVLARCWADRARRPVDAARVLRIPLFTRSWALNEGSKRRARLAWTSSTRTVAVDVPINSPRSSSLSPWERAGVRAPQAERSNGPNRLPHPLCPCREAQRAGCAGTPKDVHAWCSD